MTRLTSLLAIAATTLLVACGGGSDAPRSDTPPVVSINTVAGFYTNDAYPNNGGVIIDTDGTFWSLVGSSSGASISVGNASVDSDGTFAASGTNYTIVAHQYNTTYTTGNFGVNGTVVDSDHLSFVLTAGSASTPGSLTRRTLTDGTGAVPSRTFTFNPIAALTPNTTYGSTVSLQVDGSAITGVSSDGCGFSGSLDDAGRGYARVSVRFASTCAFPNTTVYGVAVYLPASGQLLVMVRKDPQPYVTYFGLSVL